MPSNPTRRRLLRAVASGLTSTAVSGSVVGRRAGAPVSATGASAEALDLSPDVAWSNEFGTSGNDAPVDSAPSGDGGAVLLVAARGATEDILVTKLDPFGEREWTRQFGTSGRNDPHGIVRHGKGYVVAGYGDLGNYDHKPWLLKLSADGTQRWRRRYDETSGQYQLEALSRSHDGGFVLGGRVNRRTNGKEELVWVLQTDNEGRKQWMQTYGNEFVWLTDVAPTRSEGYVLVGHSHVEAPDGSSVVDMTITEVDSSGSERWRRTFGGTSSDRLQTVNVMPTGYLVGGNTNSSATPGGLLMALDRRGRTIWQRVVPDASVVDVTPLSDGYAFVGNDVIFRTNRWGRVLWSEDVRTDGLKTITRVGDQLIVGGRTSYRDQDVGSQVWVGSVPLK